MRPLLYLLLLLPLSAAQTPPSRPGGKDYALFFAVEQYDNSSSWKTLPGLIGECQSIRNDLVERYGFSEESKVLKNPTLSDIMAELALWRARSYGPDDQLLVFFSGHGQFLDDVQEGFFIPRDGKSGAGEVSDRKWYSLLQLPRHVTTIRCNHILLAIDACYSGTIDSRVALKDENEEWAIPAGQADVQFNQYVHDLLANKSRILMTSGGKKRTKHPSDFVRWFREGLATLGGKDRILRTADIEELWPLGADRPLAGSFEGHAPGGNFLFVYQPKTTPKPQPDLVPKASDYDDDGIPDSEDKCPLEKGPAATKGCPDTDGDGIADKFDDCKTQAGPASNNGCPEKKTESKPVFADPMATSMVEVTGGTFKMGSTVGGTDEEPVRDVTVSTFWLSRYEVTIGQYLAFCAATNSHWPVWLEPGNEYHVETGSKTYYKEKGMIRTNTNFPIASVSWLDAVAYCDWLKEKTGKNYRLPTEAEWEFAARGGNKTQNYTYAGSNKLADVGWYNDNSSEKIHAVGGLKPNELELYDMSGNVWEWCADWHRRTVVHDTDNAEKDPKKPGRDDFMIYRGGGWFDADFYCRSVNREDPCCSYYPTERVSYVGFRVAQDK